MDEIRYEELICELSILRKKLISIEYEISLLEDKLKLYKADKKDIETDIKAIKKKLEGDIYI